MNETIVCKFGGSSLADAACFHRVREIVLQDARRRYIVVSAPGRRAPEDQKITDLLYRCHALRHAGRDCAEDFSIIRNRYAGIAHALGLTLDLDASFDLIRRHLGESSEYAASRGEYLCAQMLAAYLEIPCVDAAQIVRFRDDGSFDSEATDEVARAVLSRYPRAVIPGFYGCDWQGRVRTFSRGGSDITGAILARATRAALYENWTDVDGFLCAAPRILPGAACASTLSYVQLRLLARMGAEVLHPDSILPIAKAQIPMQLKNTFAPERPGTRIGDEAADLPCLSGRSGYGMLEFECPSDADTGACAQAVSRTLRQARVQPECLFSFGEHIRTVVRASQLSAAEGCLRREIPDIRPETHSGLALAAVVGGSCEKQRVQALQAAMQPGCALLGMEALGTCSGHLFLLEEGGLHRFLQGMYHGLHAESGVGQEV